MKYKLFLDDIRNPVDVKWGGFYDIFGYINSPSNISVVRNYEDFRKTIETNGLPYMVSFDHDLAQDHYNPDIDWNQDQNFKEKTGYECALFLFNYCLENRVQLPAYHVHSLNPVGKQRIYDLLASYDKTFLAFHG